MAESSKLPKFIKDFRVAAPEKKPNHVAEGLKKLQERRGVVPAYNEKPKVPTDLNGNPLGGKRRKTSRRKTRRRR